jgi:hypothetical protein
VALCQKLKQRWVEFKTEPNSTKPLRVPFIYERKRTQRTLAQCHRNYFASPQNITELYQSQINTNTSLGKVIAIDLGPTYSYTFTNTMQTQKKNTFISKEV